MSSVSPESLCTRPQRWPVRLGGQARFEGQGAGGGAVARGPAGGSAPRADAGRCRLLVTGATRRGQCKAQSLAAPKAPKPLRRDIPEGGTPEHSTPGSSGPTHRGVIQDDVTAGCIPVKNVLLQVLDESALGRGGTGVRGCFLHSACRQVLLSHTLPREGGTNFCPREKDPGTLAPMGGAPASPCHLTRES